MITMGNTHVCVVPSPKIWVQTSRTPNPDTLLADHTHSIHGSGLDVRHSRRNTTTVTPFLTVCYYEPHQFQIAAV